MKKHKKKLLTLLKFGFSALGLYLVFTKIEPDALVALLRNIRLGNLSIAALFFVLSKVLASVRLHDLFRQADIPISQSDNGRLYLLGMFYNLFLPGGIGGDGYKIYLLSTHHKLPARTIFAAILLDRLSGVFMLALLALGLFYWVGTDTHLSWLALAAIPVLLLLFFGLIRFFFRKFIPSFFKMNVYSFGVQLLQIFSAYFILLALGRSEQLPPYLFLFLVSSIVTIIPITIGGAGARELTFLYGARWFGADAELAVALSFSFYLITVIISFLGIFYVINGLRMNETAGSPPRPK